jgi:hypothetical protein
VVELAYALTKIEVWSMLGGAFIHCENLMDQKMVCCTSIKREMPSCFVLVQRWAWKTIDWLIQFGRTDFWMYRFKPN